MGEPMRDKKLYLKIIVNLLICITGLVLLIWLVPKALWFFLPFVIAIIISAIVNPLVNFLERKVKILRKHSSAIIIIIILAVVFSLIYLLITLAIREIKAFSYEINDIVASFISFLDNFEASLNKLSIKLPDNIANFLQSLDENIEHALTTFAERMVERFSLAEAGSYVSSAANVLLLIIITILATYFLIIDRNKISSAIRETVPASIQEFYRVALSNVKTAIGGYFKAQFKLMFIILFIMFVGFSLLKVKYAFLLAVLIAILDFLPVFGTGAVLGPWAVINIITGDYLYAVALIIIYLACLLIKQLLQPKLVGDSVGISPLAALIFMFIGYQLKGVVGMIIGIPVGMVLISFYRAGFFNRIIRGFTIIIRDINNFRKY